MSCATRCLRFELIAIKCQPYSKPCTSPNHPLIFIQQQIISVPPYQYRKIACKNNHCIKCPLNTKTRLLSPQAFWIGGVGEELGRSTGISISGPVRCEMALLIRQCWHSQLWDSENDVWGTMRSGQILPICEISSTGNSWFTFLIIYPFPRKLDPEAFFLYIYIVNLNASPLPPNLHDCSNFHLTHEVHLFQLSYV